MLVAPFTSQLPLVEETLHRGYQALQWGKNIFAIAHKTLSARLLNTLFPTEERTQPLSPELQAWLKERYEALLQQDWQDAVAGLYPPTLLFDAPWEEFLRFYPVLWLDLLQMWQRARSRQFQEFAKDVRLEDYPQYYRQNFHYQTDGYLSETSANLYDLQVELLFGGTADAMRRRVIAPIAQHFATHPPTPPVRILDVACGTGRTLKQLRYGFPKAALFGIDLSPTYLRKANSLLATQTGDLPQLIQGNAESLPYVDNYFSAVTCVFLFHELPAPVRQNVINECARVLQPGGVFVICDSIQALDSPEQRPMMENFANLFHEPFYRNYIEDDLNIRLEKAGLVVKEVQHHFMSKYWVAVKPS
ncbi:MULTISPECIES: class I SAM-dependent methyltransferase [unclassified Thermosynechococcus]|uniref:class I SAM-dependent methyltransferase n=1 Tax=unclassified Thermosynechococcus TaxID=2622553 RepID=UPI0026718B5C|nr:MULTISPECIES: class I SAM-dependent methyltransferase [unclassified Thermosynechococcus]MDR5638389.1 class I SAM-dependent methyltransferase [Thermosynechococcus sp. PP42]MDR7921081.1 class I SAM-dependent methyltransferase [Thermosynechococcus sp. HY213]WKT81709.1 class I SAM-dependent methyltransferase [Thermosynechococcus sp. PP45]WNC25320.1 class I SAM-dependent methyltransferase [Thermosynechococcus sp. PP551]WNC27898.1 class I SAM-dependent methyltransferase [Thermosynechococcus sp. P